MNKYVSGCKTANATEVLQVSWVSERQRED